MDVCHALSPVVTYWIINLKVFEDMKNVNNVCTNTKLQWTILNDMADIKSYLIKLLQQLGSNRQTL